MIKPIPTSAFGCFFRSRLEARFAVYFSERKWHWRYEPEGFELPSGYYLPDFWVVDEFGQGFFVEVKQFEPNDNERLKAQELANQTKQEVLVMTHDYLSSRAKRGIQAAVVAMSQRFEFGEAPS